MGTTLHRDLALKALRMALGQRSFVAGDLLHHSEIAAFNMLARSIVAGASLSFIPS